jgi:hypothetical protein
MLPSASQPVKIRLSAFTGRMSCRYGVVMCDLNQTEKDAILGHVESLERLVGRIRTSAASVEQRNWMDHEDLDGLLSDLGAKTAEAHAWVHQKMAATHG